MTIEQRLREMELVSDMLQIAMSEEGADDEEIKEDYGKRADETLAAMRAKLEEARRNEGKPPIEPTTVPAEAASSNAEAVETPKLLRAVQSELDAAHGKVGKCHIFAE